MLEPFRFHVGLSRRSFSSFSRLVFAVLATFSVPRLERGLQGENLEPPGRDFRAGPAACGGAGDMGTVRKRKLVGALCFRTLF